MIAELDLRGLGPVDAVDALEAALRAGLDPDSDPPRTVLPAGAGQLLVMPSVAAGGAGVKLATVGGDPRVQGIYVLFDPATLAPAAVADGIELTLRRTAAVSALAARYLAPRRPRRLLIFGRGPQAHAHAQALEAVLGVADVELAGRGDDPAVETADVICCATTAREPLFDGARVADHALVIAIGSHEPEARELDARLMRRATVVVEARSAALREAGDVIAAGLVPGDLRTLAAVVRGDAVRDPGRPAVFKSVGMAWEDLVLAMAAPLVE